MTDDVNSSFPYLQSLASHWAADYTAAKSAALQYLTSLESWTHPFKISSLSYTHPDTTPKRTGLEEPRHGRHTTQPEDFNSWSAAIQWFLIWKCKFNGSNFLQPGGNLMWSEKEQFKFSTSCATGGPSTTQPCSYITTAIFFIPHLSPGLLLKT